MGTQKDPNAKKASRSYSVGRRVTRSSTISTRVSCLPPQTESRKPRNIVQSGKLSHCPPPSSNAVSWKDKLWRKGEKDLMVSLYKAGKTYTEISQELPRRSEAAVRCKLLHIAKTQKYDKFTLERTHNETWQAWETELLVSLREIGKTYEETSQKLPGRSKTACLAKFQKLMGHTGPKRWQAWEDDLVASLFKAGKSFGEISQQIPNRSEEGCHIRLRKLLQSGEHDLVEIRGNGKKWEDWEEQLIITHHDAGRSWEEISKLLPSRTEDSIAQRWRRHLNLTPLREYSKWSSEEDQLLITLHNSHRGREDWAEIARKIPNQSKAGCILRWVKLRHCHPDLSKGVRFGDKWSKLEKEKLLSLVNTIGRRWYEIAKKLPGRTEIACEQMYAKHRAEIDGTSGPSREYWERSWDDPEETEIASAETDPATHITNEEVDLDIEESTSAPVVVAPTLRRNQHSMSYNAKKRQAIHVPMV